GAAVVPEGEGGVIAGVAPGGGQEGRLDSLGREFALPRAEVEVLRVLAEGLPNRQIAARLHVSIETVRTHVARILAKMGVQSRTQAALAVVGPPAGPHRRT